MLVYGDEDVMVPAHLNFGKYMLDRLRSTDPKHTFLHNITTGDKLTYSDFVQYSVRLGAALAELGVGKGVTVAMGGEPHTTFIPTWLAVLLTGAAFTPIESQCGRAVLTHKLNLTKPKYFICTRQFWETYTDILKSLDFIKTFICFEAIEDIKFSVKELVSSQSHVDVDTYEPAFVRGDDVALITYSSGTTGLSKGVLLTHLNCFSEVIASTQWYTDFDQPLKTGFFGDRDHTSGYDIFMMSGFISVGKTVIYDIEEEVDSTLKIVQDFQVDTLPTVTAVVEMMLNVKEDEYDLSSLRLTVTTGSVLMPQTAKQFRERYPGIKLINLYGSNETGPITTTNKKSMVYEVANKSTNEDVSCVGYAAAGVIIKIVDVETQAILGPNQRGQVCAWSPRLMKGYLGSTAPYLDAQGFYLTGDLGYYDDHKCFYLVGRLKDTICYLGYKVSPGDLEVVLLGHSAVQEAAVVGKPAGEVGELPTAFVVLRPGAVATAAELLDYVDQQVTWNMRLGGGVRFLLELPRNCRRKILRRQLRDMLTNE